MGTVHGVLASGGSTSPQVHGGAVVRGRTSGWFYYLVAAVCLVPLVVPSGPGQTAFVDFLNLVALGAFAIWAGLRGVRISLPFAAPMLLIFIGSLVATANAESVAQSLVTLAQDLYLYLWFVLLVNVMGITGDLKSLRLAWLWAAVAVSVVGVGMLLASDPTAMTRLTGLKGARAAATFYNPNMFADYIVASLFVVWSLGGRTRRILLWGATAVLLFALVATKSNGGLVALAVGLVAWGVARGLARRRSPMRVLGVAMILACVGVLGWWMSAGWGVGQRGIAELGQSSFLGRVSRSSETRLHIWTELARRYTRFPLGIGPGNSRQQKLTIASRERPESLLSKEAHNDYVGYLVERGPLALLGFLLLTGQAFLMVLRSARRDDDDEWSAAARGTFAAALIGGLAATAVHSFMIEKLHFRHFWLFLALLCAFAASARGLRRGSAVGEASA